MTPPLDSFDLKTSGLTRPVTTELDIAVAAELLGLNVVQTSLGCVDTSFVPAIARDAFGRYRHDANVCLGSASRCTKSVFDLRTENE